MEYPLEYGDREINMRKREIFVRTVGLFLPELAPVQLPINAEPSEGFEKLLEDNETPVQQLAANATVILPGVSLEFLKTQSAKTNAEFLVKATTMIKHYASDPAVEPLAAYGIHTYTVDESLQTALHSYKVQPLKSIRSLPVSLMGLTNRSIETVRNTQAEIDLGLQVFTNSDFKRIGMQMSLAGLRARST